MNVAILKKFALAAGAAAILGAAGQAAAGPAFNFDPNGTGAGAGSGTTPPPTVFPAFTADQFNGLSSELITFANGGATASATGYFYLTGASLAGNPAAVFGKIGTPPTVPVATYGLYLTFTLTDHLIQQNAAGNTYALDSLSFKFYIDKNNDTTFVAPNANTATGGTVGGGSSDDIMIASGDLIPNTGLATIGSQAQVGLTSNETFLNVNSNYFTFPTPFYAIALDAFNNTNGAYSTNASGTVGAINGAGGNVTFTNVPEPGTVALLGIAAAALGLSSRRRKS